MNATTSPRRKPDLPTHELTVASAYDIHPGLRRMVFDAPRFDYRPGQDLVFLLPLADDETGRRHYTIRGRDAVGRLLVDFVMHGTTPGPEFARHATPGDRVTVRGPRGRSYLREGTGWHLICADETGLPAALHMLETKGFGRHMALFEVQDETWVTPLPAGVEAQWLFRGKVPAGPNSVILDHLGRMELPGGEGFAILVAETSNVRALRHHLIARGMSKDRIASEGYWRPGRRGGHDHVD